MVSYDEAKELADSLGVGRSQREFSKKDWGMNRFTLEFFSSDFFRRGEVVDFARGL